MAWRWCLVLLGFWGQITSILATIKEEERIDCHPDDFASRRSCLQRNCLWTPSGSSKAPSCYFDANKTYGYYIPKGTQQNDDALGYSIVAKRYSGQPDTGIYRKAVSNLYLEVQHHTKGRLHIKITDNDNKNKRYEVPIKKYFPLVTRKPTMVDYDVILGEMPLHIKVIRKKTNTVIWDTSIGPILFGDQFLQLSTRLPSKYIYGFGEHERSNFRHSLDFVKFGMFSRDQPPGPNANLYGVHPFYMCMEEDGRAHGVLLLNSNAMDVTLQPAPALTYRTTGGVLDFYFFLGSGPEDVIQQYTELIGRPVMPAYWALGFQLCRYGYNHINTVKETIERNKKYGIPQDVQYGDIDYMERQLDFTISDKNYPGLSDYVKEIKKDGIRYITILDPAISANETSSYKPYTLGDALDIWITDDTTKKTLFNKVWPYYPNTTVDTTLPWDKRIETFHAYVAFPDFFHTYIDRWWGKLINQFHKRLEFDGLWIDMNEPAAFVHGSVNGCRNNSFEYPPYKPAILGKTIFEKTLCMSAKHYDGTREYDYHSLYGWSQTAPTLRALHSSTGKRGIVISRSTYVSSGRYAGHWLGDNTSRWGDMAKSVIGMMDFTLFGIPYIGADICGFFQEATERLCERWMQLGAFYPFSRNHNGLGNKPQDPAYFGAEFAKNAKAVLDIRYTLLPYLYTLFYEAHTTGSTVVRPLMHEFPKDKKTWTVDTQFLWGKGLLISPVLKENEVKVDAYFPSGRWYDYRTGKEISVLNGKVISLEAPLNYIPLHIRGGSILPLQDPANNTKYSRQNAMGLLVAYNENKLATGKLFWDDGESIDDIQNNRFQLLQFRAFKNSLDIQVVKNSYRSAATNFFGHITLYGLETKDFDAVDFKNDSLGKAQLHDGVLKITGLNLSLAESHRLEWTLTKTSSSSVQCAGALVFLSVFSMLWLY